MSNTTAIIAAIVVIVIVLAGAYFLYNGSMNKASGTSQVAVQMTDPPTAPAGTSAMFVSYSSVQVEDSNGGWVSAQGSGTVNVFTLENSTQTLATANVAQNTTIQAVKFEITAVSIVVNGTAHNVTPENSTVMVSVSGNQRVNSTTSAVVVDIAPTVTAQGSTNATTYVMSSNAEAAVVINANATVSINTNINTTAQISSGLKSKLGLNIG